MDITASELEKTGKRNRRVINIELWDSWLAYDNYPFTKLGEGLRGRNPFAKSETGLIDYDMDSEDELAEYQGEDINDDEEDYYGSELASKRKFIGRNDEASELYEENFIVQSDYESDESSENDLPLGASSEEIEKARLRREETRVVKKNRHI